MALYSTVNAYTPLRKSRIEDADVIFASVDNILMTPPRVRLFHPRGFDPEQYLFSEDEDDLPFLILNDIYDSVKEDPRLIMVYSPSDIVNDYDNLALYLNLQLNVKGFTNRTFKRTLTITRTPQS